MVFMTKCATKESISVKKSVMSFNYTEGNIAAKLINQNEECK